MAPMLVGIISFMVDMNRMRLVGILPMIVVILNLPAVFIMMTTRMMTTRMRTTISNAGWTMNGTVMNMYVLAWTWIKMITIVAMTATSTMSNILLVFGGDAMTKTTLYVSYCKREGSSSIEHMI